MTSSPQQSILVESPREVDVATIEHELVQLWNHASESATSVEAAPVIRACSLNLIVVTEDESQLVPLGDLVGRVAIDHPSRIFLVVADRRSARPMFEAWVSSRCYLPVPGEKQVCCEQINLIARGTEGNKIPSVVTSLLVSDVPTVLLWMTEVNSGDALLRSLVDISDRALIDSSKARFPQHVFTEWQEILRGQSGRASFGDLSWMQLTKWRTIVASVFHAMEMRKYLFALDSVNIEYSSDTTSAHSGLAQSVLFAAWLVDRLQWTTIHPLRPTNGGGYAAKFRCGGQAVNIQIAHRKGRNENQASIESITFHSSSGTTIALRATEARTCICVVQKGVGIPRDVMLTSVKDQSEAELVVRELEVLHREKVYEETLATLQSLFTESGS